MVVFNMKKHSGIHLLHGLGFCIVLCFFPNKFAFFDHCLVLSLYFHGIIYFNHRFLVVIDSNHLRAYHSQ